MRRHIRQIEIALFFACVAPTMQAETVLCESAKRDSLSVELGDVVVSSEFSKAVTSSAPLFTLRADDMKRMGVNDIAGAIHRMPGIVLRDYGGAGGMKTVALRGLGSGHTAVAYDGIVLGNPQGGDVDLSRYSIDQLSALQLVVGDNDDIFIPARAAAASGTLILSTPNADLDEGKSAAKLTARLKGGSFGYVSPYVRLSKNLSNSVALGLTGDYTHADNNYPFTLVNGLTKTRERRNNSRMNSVHTEANLLVQTSARSTLNTKFYYYDNAQHLPGAVILYNNENHEKLHDRNFFAQTTFRSVLPANLSLLANAKFNWSNSLYTDVNSKYTNGMLRQNYFQREAYASGALLWLPTKKLSFDYSADYFFNNLSSNLINDVRPTRNSVLQSATVRWQTGRITLTGRLLASLYFNGARRGESASNQRRLSPSASLSVRPFESLPLFVRASFKDIFRMPTFSEYYFDHYGSQKLLPEKTRQLNLGLTWQLRPTSTIISGKITADAYMNRVNDKIVAIPFNMFVWTMTNLSKVRSHGVDATASVELAVARNHTLLLSGNYSFQRAEPFAGDTNNPSGHQVAYIPRHSGAVSAGYENPWVNISVQATGVSSRFTTNDNIEQTRLDGYVETGMTLWRPFMVKRVRCELRFDIQNLFNKQYEIVARYPMPGRSWQASLRIDI